MSTATSNAISLQTLQQTSRLEFLFTAGFEMLTNVPSLSRYYMNEFQHSLNEFELTAVKNISRISCKSCGQIHIPGFNTKVEIKVKKTNRGKKSNKVMNKAKTRTKQNVIQTTCLTCSNTNLYHGSYKKKIPKLVTSKSNIAPVISNTALSSSPSSVKKQPNSNSNTTPTPIAAKEDGNKKKKNKGKKNNLKALLSKSINNNSNSGAGGGGLGDFLSSL
jgi:RNase P subunit RPR2